MKNYHLSRGWIMLFAKLISMRCAAACNTTLDPCNGRMLPWGIGSQKEPSVQVYATSGTILMIILSRGKGCSLMKMQIIRT